MDFVAYNEILICRKPIRNYVVAGVTVGYEFQIKYPSYRGCYLSCIEDLFLKWTENVWTRSIHFSD